MFVESFYTHCFAISSWSLHSSVVPIRCQQVHAIQQYSVPAFLLVSAVIKVSFLDSTSFPNFQISVYAACILVTCLSVGCTTPYCSCRGLHFGLASYWVLIISLSLCILGLSICHLHFCLIYTGFLIISLSLCILGLSICYLHFCLIFLWALITSFILGLVFCIFALFSFGPLFISLVFCLRGLSVWYYVHTRC